MLTFTKLVLWFKYGLQRDSGAVDHYLSNFLKVHGYLAAHIGLDLPGSPARLAGVLYQHPGFEKGIEVRHIPLESLESHFDTV